MSELGVFVLGFTVTLVIVVVADAVVQGAGLAVAVFLACKKK